MKLNKIISHNSFLSYGNNLPAYYCLISYWALCCTFMVLPCWVYCPLRNMKSFYVFLLLSASLPLFSPVDYFAQYHSNITSDLWRASFTLFFSISSFDLRYFVQVLALLYNVFLYTAQMLWLPKLFERRHWIWNSNLEQGNFCASGVYTVSILPRQVHGLGDDFVRDFQIPGFIEENGLPTKLKVYKTTSKFPQE